MKIFRKKNHLFAASGLKVPVSKIEEHNGVNYLITPIMKQNLDTRPFTKFYTGDFNVKCVSETDIQDFRFVSANDYILAGQFNKRKNTSKKTVTNILINSDNLTRTAIYGVQTYDITVQNSDQQEISDFEQNFEIFLLRNRQNIDSINFKGFGENYFSYFLKTCNDFGVDYSIYIEPEKAESVPTITK